MTSEASYGKITGGRITDQHSREALNHAERYYGLVRSMRTDVEHIAKSSGYSQEDIQRIKNYLFVDAHDLGEGRIGRFDFDFAIAQSWQRLIAGKPEAHDLTLLKHELMESALMEQGMTQDEAHRITSQTYNYSEEANQYYAALKKHKNYR